MDPIRILIVEDEQLMRQVLRAVLSEEPGLEVVAEAATAREGVARAREYEPDVVLMDINLSRSGQEGYADGIEATREILQWLPRAAILVLTGHDRADYLYAALRAGARGYLLKGSLVEDVVRAVRAVAGGDSWLHPSMAKVLVEGVVRGRGEHRPLLTQRELQVLRLMARGASNREIANRLFLAEKTVKQHATRIYKKLNVRGRAQAVLYAIENGLTV